MKRMKLADDVISALTTTARTPGWNNRSRTVRIFNLGVCTLYVVPYCRWARYRQEKQAAAWHLARGERQA